MKTTIAQCAKALRDHAGVIAHAATALGLNRSTLWERVQKTPRLQKVIAECEQEVGDFAEGGLRKAVQAEEPWAIRYYLNTKGRDRGYSTKIAVDDGQLDKIVDGLARMGADALRALADEAEGD